MHFTHSVMEENIIFNLMLSDLINQMDKKAISVKTDLNLWINPD